MTCKQFRESLDCYVDGELSLDATAAADLHRHECPSCERSASRALALKAAVRQTVAAPDLPPGLEARIRASVAQPPPVGASSRVTGAVKALAALAALVLFAVALGAANLRPTGYRLANAFDGAALRLDDTSAVVLEGTVLCRDCELEQRYGVKASCRSIGHHGAIATADGRIWNIVEQRSSSALIHDERLLGRKVVVRGRVYRGSRAVVVESYDLAS
jgi:hypothetical protein